MVDAKGEQSRKTIQAAAQILCDQNLLTTTYNFSGGRLKIIKTNLFNVDKGGEQDGLKRDQKKN